MAVEIRKDLLTMHAQLHLRLTHAAIGTFPCHSRNSLPVNRLLLVFADSGRDDSYIREPATGKLHPMRAGHGYFIPCRHEIDQHQTGELHFVSFQFTLDLFYGFDLMAKFPECRVIDDPGLIAEARNLIRRRDAPTVICRINAILFLLCTRWLDENPGILEADLKYRKQYESLLEYVEQHGDARMTVGILAEMSRMRQDVFSRKFTREMGLAPKDFIVRTLVRKASLLLGGSGLLVKEAADRLHFSSEYYFSRFFRRYTGMSPREFRRLNNIEKN